MRDSGYKSTATALDEFVDNAIQAQADKVDIVIGCDSTNTTGKGSTISLLSTTATAWIPT